MDGLVINMTDNPTGSQGVQKGQPQWTIYCDIYINISMSITVLVKTFFSSYITLSPLITEIKQGDRDRVNWKKNKNFASVVGFCFAF